MRIKSENTCKPKVLIFHPALTPYRIGILNALFHICQTSLVLLTRNNANQHFDQKKLLAALIVKPTYLDRVITIWGRNVPFSVKPTIDMHAPDIVITSEFSAATFIVALLKMVTKNNFVHVIWTDDNVEIISRDKVHRKIARFIFVRLADAWLFVSNEVQTYYQSVIGIKQPSALIPVIHDDEVFRRQLANTDQVRQRYITEHALHGKHVVLFVGRLVKVKALEQLIKAYKIVAEELVDSVLVLVGEGEECEKLVSMASELNIADKVKFVGRFEGDELLAWYQIGTVFALSSSHEPFGAVVNEALIAGIPAVVSNNVGAKSLIEEGINGSIVDATRIEDFSNALLFWLNKRGPLTVENKMQDNLMNQKFTDVVTGVNNLFHSLQVENGKQ